MGDVLDRGLQHPPETRLVPVGSAVNALVLKGLGCVTPQRALGPRCFQHTPPPRLMAPGVDAQPLHADTRGRPGDRREADGVTALDRLMAATAAPRRGLAPTVAPLDRPSVHGDGRDHRAAEPEAEGIHRPRGDRRDHRPDRNHVMLARMVEPQAGRPRLRQPLSGHRRAGQDVGPVVTAPIQPRQTTHGTTSLVADSALYRAETLQQLGDTGSRWITRVPAPVTEAQEALAQAPPHPLAPLVADDRDQGLAATDGGVPPRGILDYSAHRRPQAQRHVDQHWLQQREAAAKAFQQLCRMACAWAAEAQPALTTVAHGLQAASGHEGPSYSRPRDGTRGRPGPDTTPGQVGSQLTGALTSSLAAHDALIAAQRCVLRATNALDAHRVPPQARLAGYQGQQPGARGVRCLHDPGLLASARSRKQPERSMALLMVMTVCLLVYAALEYRLRKALQDHDATFPHQPGQPVQPPTARGVFPSCVGIHLLRIRGEGAFVLHRNDQHQPLRRLLGRSDVALYA